MRHFFGAPCTKSKEELCNPVPVFLYRIVNVWKVHTPLGMYGSLSRKGNFDVFPFSSWIEKIDKLWFLK